MQSTKPPQPRRLNATASAPSLTGQSLYPSDEDLPPPGFSPVGTVTRPGRNSLPVTGYSASLGQTASNALYGTPSYSSVYIEPEDLEPGPGTYDLQSSLGPQSLSTKETPALVTLTAKHDKSWSKVLISKEHCDAFKCRSTPGPGTYKPESVKSQARVRFGTGKRKELADTKFRAPGPVYEVRGVPDNPQAQVKFGKGDRFMRDGASLASQLSAAGPGQYELDSVFDGVRLAKSFGASHRAYDGVRFPGSDKEFIGRNSPGPGALKPFFNDGKNVSFGRAERLPKPPGARAPGPGAYEPQNRSYPFSRNQSCFSFGRPHARSRMDWKLAGRLHNSTWGIN